MTFYEYDNKKSVNEMDWYQYLTYRHCFRAYWAVGGWRAPVADLMSRDRFLKLLSTLHFTDNLAVTQEMKDTDKLWKVRPWLEKFQEPLKTIPLAEPLMRSWYLLKRSLVSGSACGANPTPGGYGPEQLGAS